MGGGVAFGYFGYTRDPNSFVPHSWCIWPVIINQQRCNMARLNQPLNRPVKTTHEGAVAFQHLKPLQQLRRSTLACLLWEKEFYESGETIADRILKVAAEVRPADLASLANEARTQFNIRHAPLLLLTVLAKTGAGSSLVSDTIAQTIQRADELTEFLAIYAQVNGVAPDKLKKKLSAQVKKGLAKAFGKFDEYQLAKYDREGAIRLRDALFLVHPKPATPEQDALWKRLVNNELAIPDTWETQLSAGGDAKEVFTRLIVNHKLGYLALLRNLRNMVNAKVDDGLIRGAILARRGAQRVLPFRYVAAARACPQMEPELDKALVATINELPALAGNTVVLVDVSRSMEDKLSAKGDLKRIDAAAALASMINCDGLRVFTFSDKVKEVPPRRGMSGVDAIINSQTHNGTRLFDAVAEINDKVPNYSRIIVITDEQATGVTRFGHYIQGAIRTMPEPHKGTRAYVINVASAENGVGYGPWTHIDGFSEQVLRFISETESENRAFSIA